MLFTSDQLSAIAAVYQQIYTTNEETPVALDPTRSKQEKELLLAVLNAAGWTDLRYPNLHKVVRNGPVSDTANNMVIADAGINSSSNATALTWLATETGTLYSGSTVIVLDGDEDTLLAYGATTDVLSGMNAVHTRANTATSPASKHVRILGVNYTVPQDTSSPVQFTAVAGQREAISIATNPPQVTLPVQKSTNSGNNYLWIAIGRDNNHSNHDADYSYTEPVNWQNPYLLVPFAGSMTLPYQIAPQTTSADIQYSAMIYVDYGNSGGNTVELASNYTSPTVVQNAITIDTTNNSISWNFPYDGHSVASTKSLVFQNGPADDKISYFFFKFWIPVTGSTYPDGKYSFSVYSYSSAYQTQPFSGSENGAQVLPLKYWWHCLAQGTQVIMADGSQKNVEELTNSHRVRTGSHGAHIGVEATTMGHHESTAKQTGLQGIYRLRTKDGKELIATGAHPIMTPSGAMMACYLNADDAVLVAEGVSSVASCEPIDHSGLFFDLKLGNEEDRASMGQNPVCTYFANGIQVGDHLAMHNQADQQRYDLNFMLPRIDADLRTDYTSAVQDRFR